MINSSIHLLFGIYFPLHQRNVVGNKSKAKQTNHEKNPQRDINFHLTLTLMLKNPVFLMKSKNSLSAIFTLYEFWERVFLEVIELPFHRGLKFNKF